VTLNKSAGQITMNNAALASATNVAFTLTNSLISANDVMIVNVAGGAATAGTYNVFTSTLAAGSATIVLRNISAGSLSEAVVINYAIIHGA
jgi:predicted ThiF/HesA family dinucleotide-utilizing enzyme